MARQFAVEVVRRLIEAGFTAYWAGGCVRDLLRGEDPSDYDVATDATPEQVREVFGRKRTLAVGESFGVIIVLGPKGAGLQVEVATFRSETDYADGRRPSSVRFCTPEEDAQRRDFTINGMFFDPVRETVHDFVGGQADLAQGIVRAIGDPRHRMAEDKLRMLRGVRFAAKFRFALDRATADAIRDMASQVVIVSAERIAQELRKTLENVHREQGVRLLEELGLLDVILPEVRSGTIGHSLERRATVLRTLSALGPVGFESATALLLRDVDASIPRRGKGAESGHDVLGICRRLKLSNEETDRIVWMVHNRRRIVEALDMSLAQLKQLAAHAEFPALLHLERTFAQVSGESEAPFARIDRFLSETPPEQVNPPELIDGGTLIELGYRPGKLFKFVLEGVRTAQLNEEISTKEEAVELVRRLAPR